MNYKVFNLIKIILIDLAPTQKQKILVVAYKKQFKKEILVWGELKKVIMCLPRTINLYNYG